MEMHFVFGAVDRAEPWHLLHFLYASGGARSPMPLITDAERQSLRADDEDVDQLRQDRESQHTRA